MTAATVLVPTHDHGPTLRLAVESALAQTVEGLEVLIVGDGATDVTRSTALALAKDDARVRFLDLPKGERHGERNRHIALEQASGPIVCYLSDDDLWLPEHVAQMAALLETADFAAGVRLMIHPGGEHEVERIDPAEPYVREWILAGRAAVALTCAGHTLKVYRELPFGWRPAPGDVSPTLYMWQQLLAHPACRAAAGTRLTSINFPDEWRNGWTPDARAAEIAPFAARLGEPAFREELEARALESALDKWAQTERRLNDLVHHSLHLQSSIETLEARRPAGRLRQLAGRLRAQ